MSVTVQGKFYSDADLEAMSVSDIRSLALAQADEAQSAQREAQSIASTAQSRERVESNVEAAKQTIGQPKTEAQRAAEETFAESLPLETLRELSDMEMAEQVRQADLAQTRESVEIADLEKETDGLTAQQIREKYLDGERRKKIAESPEGKLQAELRSTEQQLADAQFVRDQLAKKNSAELDALVSQKVAEQTAQMQEWQAMQQRFVDSHPDWIAIPENANALVEFLKAFVRPDQKMTDRALELAYSVCKQRGLLKLRSEKEVQQQAQLRENIVNPRPTKRSSSVRSSVSSATTGNLYEKPAELTEDEMYLLPIDELKRRADAQMNDPRDASNPAPAGLSRFGLPM